MSIPVFIQRETKRAILVLIDGKSLWFPKSQITITDQQGCFAHLEAPDWLLKRPPQHPLREPLPSLLPHDPDDGQAWSKRKKFQKTR